jgi:hypothetical protein
MTKNTPFPAPATTDTVALTQLVLSFFERLMVPMPDDDASSKQRGPGRPETLQIPHVLLSCLLMIMRGTFAMADVHRSLLNETIGSFAPLISFSRQAVRQRLIALQLTPFTELLHRVADGLSQREPRTSALSLAPFAPAIVAVDETKLASVARLCDETTLVPKDHLLVGKLAALFDLRRQQWVHVQFLSDPVGNGVLATLLLLEGLPKGSLILADLGYFGYAWFRYLSEQGWDWVSRLKSNSSYKIVHTFYEKDGLLDALVWLGTYNSHQYPHLVRLVQYRHGGLLYRYITSVTDPTLLPLADVVRLYARRWDIEMAFKLIKQTLGLRLWWACERVLVLQQLLLMLTLAQVIHAFQQEIASEAGVEPLEVSMVILFKLLPSSSWVTPYGLASEVVTRARLFGIIRPSRYVQYVIPAIPPEEIQPEPPDLVKVRPWKQTVRKKARHPRRTDPSDFRFFPLLLI